MAQQNIDFGTFPDDPSADAIRTAFQKVQQNFNEIYDSTANAGVLSVNRTAGAGINLSSGSTGNVIVNANIASITVRSTSLGLNIGSSPTPGTNSALYTNTAQTLWVDLPSNVSIGNLTVTGVANFAGNITTGNANLGNTATANYFVGDGSNLSNVTAESANTANTAGTVTTAAQPNITSVGTLTGLQVSGSITPTANVTYDLGNATNAFRDLYLSGNTIILGNSSISVGPSGIIVTNPNSNTVTVAPGGLSTYVQYNSNGTFGGSIGMTYVPGTTTFTANNIVATSTANLGAVANVKITGGSNGQFLTTNGSGVLSWANIATATDANFANYANIANIANSVAASNVSGLGNLALLNKDGNASNIFYGNGVFAPPAASANYGNSDVATFLASYGSNTMTTTGNVSVGNIIGNGQALTGITGANVTGYVPNATHANIADVANSVALSNVVGAGNIAALNIDGTSSNVLYGNGVFAPASLISGYGNSNVASFLNAFGSNTMTTTGNVSVGNIIGNGQALTGIAGANVTGTVANANYATNAGTSNTANTANISNIANTAYSVALANVVGAGNIASINRDGSNSNVLYGNGVFAPISGGNGTYGNADVATFLASYGSNTMTTTGNVSVGNIIGNGQALTGIAGANVTGTVANANYAAYAGNVTIAGQSNITSLGTLTGLTSGGNVLFTAAANVSLGAVANVHITGGSNGQVLTTDGSGTLSWSTVSANASGSNIANGNSNVNIATSGGPVTTSVAGNANVVVVTGTGANVDGTVSATGNILAPNFIGTGAGTPTVTSATNLDLVATSGVRVPSNISLTGANVSLGAVGNLHITGGTANYVLQTDGAGNLSWTAQTGGGGNGVTVQDEGANVVVGATTINFTGNAVAASNVGGVATITINSSSGNGTPAGSDSQVQYNNAGAFGANTNLTFDAANANFSVGDWDSAWSNVITGEAIGNLHVRGEILVGTNPLLDDTYGTMRMLGTSNAYGFVSESSGMLVLTNEEASWHQAIILADTRVGQVGTIFGISVLDSNTNPTNGQEANWQVAMDVQGTGFYVPVISAATTSNALFFDPTTGKVTYGAASNVSSSIAVQDEGSNVVAAANTINFVGNGVVASNVGGVATITISGGNSNANPGGANTQVQYNDDGVFGGTAGFTFNKTTTVFTANKLVATSTANLGNVGNVTITGGSNNYILVTDGTGNLNWANLSSNTIGNIAAGGANTQVQYNDDGILGGNPGMVFDEGLTRLTANNFVASSTANLGNVGNVTITGGSANYVLTTDGAGNLTWSAAGGASAIVVQEEGTNVVATANTINFVGNGVTASNVSGVATITIPGGGSSSIVVQDEGANVLTSANTINFVGNGVVASNVGGVATITISGGNANATPAGSNTQIQFNDSNNFGAVSGFTFDKTTTVFTANKIVATSTANLGNVGNVTITGGSNNFILTTDGSGNLRWGNGSSISNVAAGGANTQVQYNDDGILGGNPAFTFDEGNTLITANNLTVSAITRLGNVGNVKITGGSNNFILTTDGSGNLNWANLSSNTIGNIAAGGANTQVQYNDNGILGGNPGMVFDEGLTRLTANNFVATSTANLGNVGNVTITGGSNNFILTTDGTGNLAWANLSSNTIGNIAAGGSNTQVQYNDNGILGGNPAFVFDEGLTRLTANNFVATSTANLGNVGNVTITGGSANFVLTTNGSGNLAWANVANGGIGNIAAGGSNTQIQYNDDGILGGNPGMTFNEGTTTLTANNFVASSTANLGNIGNVRITGGTALQVLATVDGAGNLNWATIVTDGAAGSNTQVQYNDNGSLGGNPGFVFDEGTTLLTANNFSVTNNANVGGNLVVSGAGSFNANVNMNGKWINNVGYPNLSTDAATKSYVDTLVSTGISYHQSVNVATTTTLATATGGTTAYNSPNGAANGIGAYISTTGTFLNIDGANVQTVGTRILVKDEANATWNGVYTYANTTAIVRSTDTDESGVGSPTLLGINDYFFTIGGVVNEGVAFIVSAPSGTITFGTSNITFAQFSTSQVYDAGTGIAITGTVISANASQTQVTAVGTLTSLSVSGNANVGNLGTGGLITATGNITGGNLVTAGQVSATGNGTFGNISTAGTFSANTIINIFSYQGTSATITGNITGGNLLTGGLISATGNITGGNIITAGIMSSTGNATHGNANLGNLATANFFSGSGNLLSNIQGSNVTGNVTSAITANFANFAGNVTVASQPNITSTGTLVSLSVSGNANVGNLGTAGLITATGNITGGNLLTGGLISATGNITSGNLSVSGTITATSIINVTNYTGTTATITGNISGGNLYTGGLVSATGNITGSQLISTVSTGTAPIVVSSTTRVANLNVAYANVTDFINVNLVSTGTFYPVLGNATSGNIAESANANLSFNAATGALSATLFTGTLTTGAQPNITSTGTLSSLSVTGNANVGNLGTAGLITATGNITGGNISGTLITGTLTTGAQPNITSTGTLASLSVSGNANVGNLGTAGLITATGNINGGNINTGGLVSVTGNVNAGNISVSGNITATTLININNYQGTSANLTGNISGANIIANAYHIRSVATSISAAGSTQGTGTVLAKEFNQVSTVASGAGVVLPAGVPGLAITITNSSANSLLVYPASGASINLLATNAGYTQSTLATIQYITLTGTQWYTVGGTYA